MYKVKNVNAHFFKHLYNYIRGKGKEEKKNICIHMKISLIVAGKIDSNANRHHSFIIEHIDPAKSVHFNVEVAST